MLTRRCLVIARQGTRLLLSDPAPIIVNLVMPLLLAAFFLPATRAQLRASGIADATGAEQVVPGMAVMFAFLSISLVGTLFFREHVWGTWDRLRATGIGGLDLVVGKVGPLYCCLLAQSAVFLGAGHLLFGYRPKGSLVALAAVLASFEAMLVCYGIMLVAVFATMDQALVVGNLGGMVMAGLGGALTPVNSLPHWAQVTAHFTPAYWALRALRDLTLKSATLPDVTLSIAVLLTFTVAFAAITALRFRSSDIKIGST
jgi:ABC-2 type transport system permease protein